MVFLRLIHVACISSSFFLKKYFVYLFLEREGKGGREGNINGWLPLAHPPLGTQPATQACALTGNQTRDLLVHRLALHPLIHTIQGSSSLFLLLSSIQLYGFITLKNLFTYWWTFEYLLSYGYCEQYWSEYSYISLCVEIGSHFSWLSKYLVVELLGHMVITCMYKYIKTVK